MREPNQAEKLAFSRLQEALEFVRKDELEDADDAICDVLDQFYGFCGPRMRLFPDVEFDDG